MPAKKKILVGGSIAGLVLSLALPVSQSGGLSTSSEVAAGVRPKFSKPWHVDKNQTGKETVKSYPLPEHLKEGYTGEMPADPGAPPSEVMQELQQVYEQNGGQAPEMGGNEVPVQEAGMRRERERSDRERAAREQRDEDRGNAITRFFDRLKWKKETETVKSYPLPEQPAKPAAVPPAAETPENIVESKPAPLPAKTKKAPMIALPSPDNAPVAEVIIPPQPQPNLLPGMDLSEPETIKPMITQGVETSSPNDPFPLPPLPEGFEKKQEQTVQAEPKPAAKSKAGGFSLPPLPGFEEKAAPQTAQANPPAAIETETVEAHPLSEAAEMPAAEPAQPEELQVEAAPAVEPTPEPLAEATADEDLMSEALSVPEVAAAEPEMETEATPEPAAEATVELEADAEAEPAKLAQAPQARPSGEVATSLPLAPSATGNRWENRKETVKQDQFAEESQLPASGWRSRNGNSSVPDVNREPNTLNIPAEARPAELPKPQTAESDPNADKYRRIAERGERAGFKGFCPVALKDYLELVDASPKFRAEFEGQVYYFASQAHLDNFQADPLRYVPAQGGIDLVKYLENGQSEPGRLDYAVWYQDRLFLFASPTTLETFRAEPGRFIK